MSPEDGAMWAELADEGGEDLEADLFGPPGPGEEGGQATEPSHQDFLQLEADLEERVELALMATDTAASIQAMEGELLEEMQGAAKRASRDGGFSFTSMGMRGNRWASRGNMGRWISAYQRALSTLRKARTAAPAA